MKRLRRTEEISDYEIVKARGVLEDHVVEPQTREGALESLLWCIASQALEWRPASTFIKGLRAVSSNRNGYATWDLLTDKSSVYEVSRASGLRFAKARRFEGAIDYFVDNEDDWWRGIGQGGNEERSSFVKDVNWVGYKTLSFWHICMGGKNMIALDVHILKNLHRHGIEIDPAFYIPVARNKDSQLVRKSPSPKRYVEIESQARDLFSRDERFLLDDGEVDMALVDALLWWRGAGGEHYGQVFLYDEMATSQMPYAKVRDFRQPVRRSDLDLLLV